MLLTYKFITAFLALTGCFSLLMTGEINPIMSVSGLALFPGYYRFLKSEQQAPRWAIGVLSTLTLIAFAFDAMILSGDVFIAVAHLTITFQGVKSFDLRDPWDSLQVFFMSLLQMIIASELTYSITFGIVFIIFMIMLITAMVLSHFIKEGAIGRVDVGKPVIIILSLTLLTTAFFFISLPRSTHRFLGKSHIKSIKTVGFSDNVDFGSFGAAKLNHTVVMRVDVQDDTKGPYYWRGLTLDYFDGSSWKNTLKERQRIRKHGDQFIISPYKKLEALKQDIYMEPLDSDILFGLSVISGVEARAYSLIVDDAMNVYFPKKLSRKINYTVYSVLNESYEDSGDERYVQLPKGIERIRKFGKQLTSVIKTDRLKARAVERYLKENYIYSLEAPAPPAGTGPIEYFLFDSKKGYCEYYATSMVLMLRGMDIPSRIVNGFYGGEKNEYGGYIIVRQSDAHSWVEAFVEGEWTRFDPTPSIPLERPPVLALILDSLNLAWSRYVIGYSFYDQKEIIYKLSAPFKMPRVFHIRFGDIRVWTYVILAVVGMFSVYIIVKRLRFRKYGFVSDTYMELRRLLKNKGVKVDPSMTAGDIERQVSSLSIQFNVEEFLKIYQEHRFGRRKMNESDRHSYTRLIKNIKKSL
jgi:transglutaminase-like putative cysteine protease